MDSTIIKAKAKDLMDRVGGTIFGFPVEEENPFSSYAVVMFAGGMFHVYPECNNIQEAAVGVQTILELMQKEGYKMNFDRDVRLVSYDAQMNAPDVTMRRIKRDSSNFKTVGRGTGFLKDGVDVNKVEGDEEKYDLSARGVIKFSYLSMVDDKLPKAEQFMNEYYKLLSMRRYGKTAAAIKQEIRRMDKDKAIKWIDETYKKYIRDDMEVMNIMESLKTI